jgi:hypothetical protein
MFHTAPSLLVVSVIAGVGLMFVSDLTVFWVVFAVTLIATTLVAIKRSIPRKER